jgi:hypothetical protein
MLLFSQSDSVTQTMASWRSNQMEQKTIGNSFTVANFVILSVNSNLRLLVADWPSRIGIQIKVP